MSRNFPDHNAAQLATTIRAFIFSHERLEEDVARLAGDDLAQRVRRAIAELETVAAAIEGGEADPVPLPGTFPMTVERVKRWHAGYSTTN